MTHTKLFQCIDCGVLVEGEFDDVPWRGMYNQAVDEMDNLHPQSSPDCDLCMLEEVNFAV